MPENSRYRDNVCAVIRKSGSVLLCHRIDSPRESGWQFPQGGIDTSKNIIDELKRELYEEIGITDIKILSITEKTYTYDFPADGKVYVKGFSGQKQRWVLAELIDDSPFDFNTYVEPEFDDYMWVSPSEAVRHAVHFKKNVYIEALTDLGLIASDNF